MPLYVPQPHNHPGARSGAYYCSPAGDMGTATTTVSANTLYAQPFLLSGATIDRLAIEVTTGAAGLCRVGIASNSNGRPDTLLLDAGSLDTTAAAIVEAVVNFTFPDDWVWVLAVFNATPAVRRTSVGGTGNALLGGSAPSGAGNLGLTAPLAYGALPSSLPSSYSATSSMASVYPRKA